MKNFKILCVIAFIALLGISGSVSAQAVIFPQADKPGAVQATEFNGRYTLSNSLFSAEFSYENGKLSFQGCEGLALVGGTELFQITLGNGAVVKASQMEMSAPSLERLVGDAGAVKGSHRFSGYALKAQFVYHNLIIDWSAVLRDESHYLRTKLNITAPTSDVKMTNLIPMIYQVDKAKGGTLKVVGNTRGAILASDRLFVGLETPMGINTVGNSSDNVNPSFAYDRWKASNFTICHNVPKGIIGLKTIVEEKDWFGKPNGKYSATGPELAAADVLYTAGQLKFERTGNYTLTFTYQHGNHRLNIAGVDLVDAQGTVVASDYHCGFSGYAKYQNTYTLQNVKAGTYTVRYFVETKTEEIDSDGTISYSPNTVSVSADETAGDVQYVQGLWSRNTTLLAGRTWHVSSVVGIVAPGQARRSILAYSERERAVPWRPMPIYNSWYELNIDRNNASRPENNMHTEYTTPILEAWYQNLFQKHDVGIQSFVWDDGWDNYYTWECHKKFDFAQPSATAFEMGAGTGVWLGPVGGYGVSGDTRRKNWQSRGGMRLSNPEYYKVFNAAVERMVTQYHGNFFKLDGISDLPTAFGPKNSPTGEEDAEEIIRLEDDIRKISPEVYLNTTVGTWASPFWFRYTDAVWRQENDYGEVGNNPIDRERWITYRDHLVYQHFIDESPLCPINTLMTHGFILTEFGKVSKNMDRDGIIREMRCAFACGSGLVELYCDHGLLTRYNLWGELAECIRWQQNNADVLPDIHWVGGNPWDGRQENIYGWASWNGKKSTFTLRNGSNQAKSFSISLREALQIPDYIQGSITFTPSFAPQDELKGLVVGQSINIDDRLNLRLPANSVYSFDGVQDSGSVEPELTELTCTVSITKANQYGTCILPFDAAVPSSLTAYSCATVEGNTLILTQENTLQANTPYIVYAPQGASETFSGRVDMQQMPSEVSVGLLTGVLQSKTLKSGNSQYVLQNQGQGARFYQVNQEDITVPAYRCFLTVQQSAQLFYLFGGDGTGIDTVVGDDNSDAPVYDLEGRRVLTPLSGSIYIQNGKKFIAD